MNHRSSGEYAAGAMVVVGLSLSFTALGGPPAFRTLGFLSEDGMGPSLALGISADGRVVVGMSVSPGGMQAFRWTSNEGMVGLGDLPGGWLSSKARGCNADGSVIVGSGDDGIAGDEGTPVRWTESGIEWLGTLGGPTTYGQALATSADGRVIVGASQSPDGIEAFRWTEETGLVSIGDLPGGYTLARATGVSADGTRIVGYGSTEAGVNAKAFLWTQEGGMVPIGEGRTAALGISGDGRTIVGTHDTKAFRWTEDGGLVDLFVGSGTSYASGASADGSVIVGLANYDPFQEGGEAFIWTAQHGKHSLKAVLQSLGLDLDGFYPFDAQAISADGRFIVGYGFNKLGEQEAFLADLGGSCYPDLNGDGVLDLFDFLGYVNTFNAGDAGAECDGDEGLTLFDFLCFVNAFNQGC